MRRRSNGAKGGKYGSQGRIVPGKNMGAKAGLSLKKSENLGGKSKMRQNHTFWREIKPNKNLEREN